MNAIDDRELEHYLQRGDSLSRAYAELKSERPSPALDQAVLARARDALHGQPRRHRIRRHWPTITALAATVLLSFALVMRIALEPSQPLQPQATSVRSPPAMPAESPAGSGVGRGSAEIESAPVFAAPPDLAPPHSTLEARRPAIESEIKATSDQAPVIAAPVPPQSEPRDNRSQSAPSNAESDAGRGIVAPSSRQEARERAYPSSPEQSKTRSMMSTTRSSGAQRSAAAASEPEMHEKSLAKEEATKVPEAWLEEIEQLRVAGKFEAAERELERFKAAYPGYLEALASPPQK